MENATEITQFLSVTAVAGILGISRPSAHALVRRGELPGIRVGQIVRIPVTGLETFLISQGLNPSTIYRGTGQTATASPSPVATTNANQRKPASVGATVR